MLSANAVASTHVGKEVERASSKRKPIIAFRADAAPLNPALEYFLSESQWIDVAALGVAAALAKLAEATGAEALGQGAVFPSLEPTVGRHADRAKKRIIIAGSRHQFRRCDCLRAALLVCESWGRPSAGGGCDNR